MTKIDKLKKLWAFSIIEVMVAITIVGILAIMAVAGYKKYMAKTLVANAIAAAVPLQKIIEDFYQNQGFLPGRLDIGPFVTPFGYTLAASRYQVNSPAPDIAALVWWSDNGSGYCSAGDVQCDGIGSSYHRQIEIRFTNPTSAGTSYLAGKTFILTANLANGSVSWLCMPYPDKNTPDFSTELLPPGCHNAALDH